MKRTCAIATATAGPKDCANSMTDNPSGTSSAGSTVCTAFCGPEKPNAVGEAGQGGVHDELCEASIDFEGGYEARGNGHYDRCEEHEWRVVAEGARAGAVDERADGRADNDREHHVAAFGGRISTNDLVVSRQIIFKYVASAVRAHNENESGDNGAALNDAGGKSSGAASTELVVNKGGKKDGKRDERTDHSATVPGILSAGPRECEKEAGQRGEEE